VKDLWELLTDEAFLRQLFRGEPPWWLPHIMQPVLILLVLVAIIGFIWTNLKEPVKAALQFLRHLRLTPEARDRIRLRQLCAQRLRSRLPPVST
jgi:hypothetical protein